MASTAKAINVLIYSGTGTTTDSVRHCVSTLRRLLSPHFAVSTVSANVLLKEPWLNTCALLVFPGGADLPYCSTFNGAGNRRIAQYVRQGGSYLGFCAGGYYGSAMCEFEVDDKNMAVVGKRELAFFPGTSRGAAFKGFQYASEKGARAVELLTNGGEKEKKWKCYFNGGGVFVGAAEMKDQGVEVLAQYAEDIAVDGGNGGKAAVVYRKVGEGRIVLTGPHPEFASANLDKRNGGPEYAKLIDELAADDAHRLGFMKLILEKLGLKVPEQPSVQVVPDLSSIHLTSLFPQDCSHLLSRLSEIITEPNDSTPEKHIKDETDTFVVEVNSNPEPPTDAISSMSINDTAINYSGEPVLGNDYSSVPKRLIVHDSGLPSRTSTPQFVHSEFYGTLQYYRRLSRMSPSQFGTFMLYGETVTSTNTLLEKNVKLLTRLPSGTTFTATTQVAGRGRGSNVWVSPAGCLIFSTILQHPLSLNAHSPIIFIQYIVAMAIVKAIKTYDPLNGSRYYRDLDVKLKWPNDIYAKDPSTGEYTKICGILVHTTFLNSCFHLVIGCGINTSNPHPSTSLNTILSQLHPSAQPFTITRLLAAILVTFEELYLRFIRPPSFGSSSSSSFVASGLRDEYYSMWLHNDQEVALETEGGAKGRVTGVTEDFGLLEVEMLEGDMKGRKVELQPDGNSFDFFRGLVRRKK